MSFEENERRKYIELNDLKVEELTEQDKENIRFNIEYARERPRE